MTYLSSNQLKQYEDEGYISPIEVLSSSEALEARKEIELIEKKMPNEIDKSGRYNVHLISPKLDSIVHNSKILDAVESIIGKNILVCSTTLFIKNPNEQGFVSYHQDAKYIGLEPHNWVTAWVALTDSNENNGCMKMWPKSHLNIKDHNEKFNESNLLTRGQTVENIPEDEVKSIELKAGQMSLHHPRVVHGSGINKSNDRRIGFVIQSYIGDNVDQVIGKMYVQRARGEDKYKHHEYSKIPLELMGKNEVNSQNKANEELAKIFYSGSKKIGKF
jgi:ectoine hydroxylase-related dioxygenase (phytanoyl-CoA dioxygenase family)